MKTLILADIGSFSDLGLPIVISIVVLFVVFFITREFWLWYFKSNEHLRYMKIQIKLLTALAQKAGVPKDDISEIFSEKDIKEIWKEESNSEQTDNDNKKEVLKNEN